ncbi:hypothetical protein OUZ56_029825 [Daphnia magna]|uniref:Uncharacterized protein n=1 Tax=Daphnia magna TaxID=35525 RepID=A0ABR0B7Z8_9CRUS|nr:hypothetical protein OUZ56_029825 [Daphnia magna]
MAFVFLNVIGSSIKGKTMCPNNSCGQLGLHETVSKGRDRHRYIPEGLFRPSDWLSPSPHPKAPPPLLLVNYCELSPMGNWVGAGRRKTVSKPDFGRIGKTISPKALTIIGMDTS